jgi:CRISPR-associated protein Cas5d
MFTRRLDKGQWYRAPYLGCREFAARVEPASEAFQTITDSRDLGWMLHDIEFRPGAENLPHFFAARMTRGVIEVPEFKPGLQGSGGAS